MDDISSGHKIPKICGLCEKNPSKYCCPRCEVYYCSLDCYKSEKHTDCSENFYRDCYIEELAGNHVDQESQRNMIAMLKREREEVNKCDDYMDTPDALSHVSFASNDLHEEYIPKLEDFVTNGSDDDDTPKLDDIVSNDSDDENLIDLHERVKNLDLDDADAVWSVLNQDEKNAFEALFHKSSVDSIVPQWEAWWSYRKKDKLIEDADLVDKEESIQLSKCPALVSVPEFSSIALVKPESAVRFNITCCIAAYALVMRYFNGDITSKLHLDAATCMYTVCDNLNSKKNYREEKDAVESVADNCLQSNLLITDANNVYLMRQDVTDILQGSSKENPSSYCKCALSHMHTIFNGARKSIKSDIKAKQKTLSPFTEELPEIKLESAQLKLCIKKIEYYLSYLNSNYSFYVIDDNQPYLRGDSQLIHASS